MTGRTAVLPRRVRARTRLAWRHATTWIRGAAIPGALLLLLMASTLFGGATRNNLFQLAVLELIAVMALGIWLLVRPSQSIPRSARTLMVLLTCMLGCVMLQLIPIPYQLWESTPGRERAAEGLALLGLEGGWRPLSLGPEYTLSALVQCLPAVAVLVLSLSLAWRALGRLLAWAALIGGLVSAGLGLAQIAGLAGYPYAWTTPGYATGVFANPNHQASFLLMCLPFVGAMAGSIRERSDSQGLADNHALLWGAAAVVIFGGVLTAGSLFGYLLAPFVLALTLVIASRDPHDIGWGKLAAGGGLLVGAATLAVVSSGFDYLGDVGGVQGPQSRLDIYANTIRGIGDHAPFGSGLGTFERVYPLYEAAAAVPATYVNNAHNDYLQLALELGLPGMICMAILLVWILGRMAIVWMPRREYGSLRRMHLAASVSLAVPILHSLVDYPLRAPAIACLATGCIAMLLMRRREDKSEGQDEQRRLSQTSDQWLTPSQSSGSP